jgi:hypothetical protein
MDSKFKFDFNRISYEEIMGYDGMKPDAQELLTRKLIAKVITEWPFDGEPTPNRIKKLGLVDYADLQNSFSGQLEKVFKKRLSPQ